MEVNRVSPEEYIQIVQDFKVFFNNPKFCELNRDKVDDVHYLVLYKGNLPYVGLIIGQSGVLGRCPFSAPYSFPVPLKENMRIADYDEALVAIEDYCKLMGMMEIKFIFPPFFYDENCLSAWTSSLYRRGFRINQVDINYALDVKVLNQENYEWLISKKGRHHLHKAIQSGIKVVHCNSEDEIMEAYQIILKNHNAKGRPTYMSFEQIQNTFKIVPHDVFLAKLNGTGIASMIYYQISNEIIQCIYSGYLLEYSNSGVMNYLSWHAVKYYGDKGFKIIDRSTATENSIPNYGLCNFKESVGGKRSLKYTFCKDLKLPGGVKEV